MKVSKLIKLLRLLPGDVEVMVATQNPRYPYEPCMDNVWRIDNSQTELSAGSHAVVLIAKRKSDSQLRKEKALSLT